MMDVEYLQKDNSSSKPKHTANKLETDRRKLDVHRYDKIKTNRTLKQCLNFSGQESSISDNKENKLHTEQDNLMGFGDQSKEENYRRDCFVSAEICVSVNNNPGEILNEQNINGERQKIKGVSKKLSEVEMIQKNTEKKFSRKARSDVSTKEECEMQSETNFELTTKKDAVIPKTGKHAVDISPYKQQHSSPRTQLECLCKERYFTEGNSHNTLNSEDTECQVCCEKGDSLSGVRDAIPVEKAASSFREVAVHDRKEKTELNLQSVSSPGISGSVERDTNKLRRVSLDKSYFIAENEILEKSSLSPNEGKSTMQEILAFSSENILENQYAAKVSESYPLDFEVSLVQSDPDLGTEFLGNAGDLNADIALSEIICGGEDYFPKNLLSHREKVHEKKISQDKIYSLDNINTSGEKQSGEDKLEQGQKCKDLLLVAEMDSRDKGHSTKVLGKTTELQKTFCEKTGRKASLEKKEKQKKRGNDNEEKRSTTVTKVPEFL
ncbi:uncharacterized protein LOC141955989 [Athene noctua]|uniref:uncharacterized protein LOC141955989 n=1 Tax=Athene noctua TaxID=126797 RepID=UPI003EBF0870